MTSTSTTARFEQELTVSWQERVWRGVRGTAPIFVVLLGLLVWIAILNPNFTEPPVFLAFLKRAAPLMILAAGQLFVIVSGEFDLSVGSLVTAVVVAAAGLTEGVPDRTWWVVIALFGLGILVGLVNGVVTTRLYVPSFITTLGMLLILQGAVLYWSGGAPKGSLPENFRVFGRRGIEDLPVIEQLPYSVIILVVVGVAAVLLLHRTTFGKQLSAADVPLVRTLAFVLSGISAAIAGILVGGFAGISQDAGAGYEFQAISAVVLGGAVLGGGRGSMVAAMAGALALEALFTLLNLLGLPAPLRDAVQGLIIIGAVAYAAYRLRRAR